MLSVEWEIFLPLLLQRISLLIWDPTNLWSTWPASTRGWHLEILTLTASLSQGCQLGDLIRVQKTSTCPLICTSWVIIKPSLEPDVSFTGDMGINPLFQLDWHFWLWTNGLTKQIKCEGESGLGFFFKFTECKATQKIELMSFLKLNTAEEKVKNKWICVLWPWLEGIWVFSI